MELTPGQQLRQAREARGIPLAQAATATRIRPQYLEALEQDNFDHLPSLTQGRGLLRSYAQYLQLDAETLLRDMTGAVRPAPVAPAAEPPVSDMLNQAQSIFREIGDQLRRQRELIGLSLEDVARSTHLRSHHLQAIEAGKIDELPSPVQGRGMISNYANFLGFDSEKVLLRFADGLQAGLAARQGPRTALPKESKPIRPPWMLTLFSPDILVAAVFLLFLFIFVSWAILRVADFNGQQKVSQTAPSVAQVLAQSTSTPPRADPGSAISTGTPPAAASTPALPADTAAVQASPSILPPTLNPSAVQVYVAVRQRAWMRVTVDGKEAFDGRVVPGGAYLYSGDQRVEILTGNGAALQLFYNRVDLGPMGILGQVVERIFTPEGMLTPTPTATLTGQPTATNTPAPTQTPTPTPSPTLKP